MAFGVILSSFFAALGQMGDRRFRRVLLLGLVLTVALLIAVYAAFLGFLQWSVGEEATLPLVGQVTWLKDLLTWSSLGVMLILSVFLMVPVASAITSMFLEDVADAVEAVVRDGPVTAMNTYNTRAARSGGASGRSSGRP